MGVKHRSPVKTYSDLVEAAFLDAPDWQRRSIIFITKVSQYSFLLALLGLYLLSAGKALGMAFYSMRVCLPIWMLIGSLLLLPFATTARRMGTYQSLVWVNIVTLCGTVAIPISYYLIYGTDDIQRQPGTAKVVPVADIGLDDLFFSLSAFTFAMTSQFMLNEITDEMKDDRELPKAYMMYSAPFQLTAFLVAGLAGYILIGDGVTGMINENLPFGSALQAAAVCLLIHMLISYLIKGVVLCQVVQEWVCKDFSNPEDPSLKAQGTWAVVAICVLLLAMFLANVVPFFGDAVDLLGATLTPVSCWLIPIAIYLRFWRDAGERAPTIGYAEGAIISAEVILAVVVTIIGTYTASMSILEHWGTYGPPFDCHCEGIWDTCECSGDHPGMGPVCFPNASEL